MKAMRVSLAEHYRGSSRHRVLRRMKFGLGRSIEFGRLFDGVTDIKCSASLKKDKGWVSLTETG